MDVSVVIPTHNRAEKLRLTLQALAEQSYKGDWEVIVVNNASTDHTDEVVRTAGAAFSVPPRLVHEAKPGAAAARNAGARTARARVLVFLDDDMLAGPDLVERHLQSLTANPGSWILGQAQYPKEVCSTPFGRYRHSLHTLLPPDAGFVEVASFASGNCSLPAEDLRLVGGYNEEFTTAALEDVDLYVRARRVGRRIVVDPRIVTIHNDWAADSLEQFCLRQKAYSRSAPILQKHFGEDNPQAEWVRRNSGPSFADPLPVMCNKILRAMAGTSLGQRGLYRAARVLEVLAPDSGVLRLTYRTAIAGSMSRGLAEGSVAARGRALQTT